MAVPIPPRHLRGGTPPLRLSCFTKSEICTWKKMTVEPRNHGTASPPRRERFVDMAIYGARDKEFFTSAFFLICHRTEYLFLTGGSLH